MRPCLEKLEAETLSPFAVLSSQSKGRKRYETPCSIRTDMQRDRDRLLHSKAFRRLKHKTQVFIAPEGDHYRTRLTHTLEVAQISRTVARALRLNEDLTEAIALGHDLGHTAFGHAGEAALNEIHPGGFRHNHQSLRVVDIIEDLNLTWEVRDGILNHTGDKLPQTLEGQIVRICDRIAYLNHDIDDAIRAGILESSQLPADCVALLGDSTSARINHCVRALITNSRDQESVSFDDKMLEAIERLREFMFENVYIGSRPKEEEVKARYVITMLYKHFTANPHALPTNDSVDSSPQRICDYIAGMTDRYAISLFKGLYLPTPWQG
ncbi:MAG: deoxyguanosinetriphosphate triphosphohydrolase [Firmicutes bacterium]|nr:deoxyguanosinetriphosphate triphosphohydrolase [Bacillota bacterium]